MTTPGPHLPPRHGHEGDGSSGAAADGPVVVPSRTAFADALGGRRGLLDSGLATAVFVTVLSITSSTPAAAYAALATGVAVVAVRLVRREPLQQALSGLLGLGVAVVLALRLRGGDGSGFFLWGIGVSAVYALVFVGSVAVRRPLVGVLAGAFTGDRSWRTDPRVRRAFSVVTLGWAALFALRAGLQGSLLDDGVALLGFVKIAMGLPLTGLALAASWWWLRRTGALQVAGGAPPGPRTPPV